MSRLGTQAKFSQFIYRAAKFVMLIMRLTFFVLQWSQEHNVGNGFGLRGSCHRTMGDFGDQLGRGGCIGSWSSVRVNPHLPLSSSVPTATP